MTSMHPRKLLLEFGTRDFDFICRSCLSTSQQNPFPAKARWPRLIRPASLHTAQAPSTQNRNRPADVLTDQEAERRKVLEALGLLNNETKHVAINYFEQGDFGRLRRLDDRDDFHTSLTDPGGVVDTRLNELEKQLEQAKVLVDKLEEITRAKQEKDKAHDQLSITAGQGTAALRESQVKCCLISIEGWRRDHGNVIGRFNKAIERAAHQFITRGVAPRIANRLWSYYSRTRPVLATRWDAVPRSAWELFWNVFAIEDEANPNRMSRVHLVSRDMQLAGVPLTDDRQLLAVEAMFVDGWRNEAIENHKRLIRTLGTKPETFLDFWQLGLRMYCLMGDIDRAQKIFDRIMESPYQKDPRILLPVIRACAAIPTAVETGYETYRQLRTLLGDSIRMEDYDQIIASFLASNQTEYALYIFVDMMTSGAINLHGRLSLPPSVANPFFFGKWLKMLILGGDLRGAYNVLLFMRQKGIPPRPIQVNALLGALLRTKMADNTKRAEEVGWAMINARVQFVMSRKVMLRLERHIKLQQAGEGWPNATLETFKLLAENFKDRAAHPKMEALWEAFKLAELAPDTFLVNQLLFSRLHGGQGQCVPSVFRDLRERYNIKADPWTFMALWQSLLTNRVWTIPPSDLPNERSRGRALFAEMVESASIFVADGIDVHLAGKVLHTFRKVKDTVGLLVAVRALRYVFNFLPPEALIIELLMSTTDLEKALQKPTFKAELFKLTRRIDSYLEHRRKELVAARELKKGDSLPDATKREEVCNFFELYLETESQRSPLYPEGWELALRKAVEDMGLYKVQGGDTETVVEAESP